MVTYVCVRKCFWQDKLWEKGETLTWIDKNSNPPLKNFVILKEGDLKTLADNYKNDTH